VKEVLKKVIAGKDCEREESVGFPRVKEEQVVIQKVVIQT
jgi:hypothetical protein